MLTIPAILALSALKILAVLVIPALIGTYLLGMATEPLFGGDDA